jgi:hypothetical protein
MKIVKVIHGYPMRYNAGSEVYTQTLCHGLARAPRGPRLHPRGGPFAEDFDASGESGPDDPRVHLHLVNVARSRDRYRHDGVDRRFAALLDRRSSPTSSTSATSTTSRPRCVSEANRRQIPIVYTLHDYWVMCPRGSVHADEPRPIRTDLWAACDGQDDRKCAERCYSRYFSGAADERDKDVAYWTGWVRRRMRHIREVGRARRSLRRPARSLPRPLPRRVRPRRRPSCATSTTASIGRASAGRRPRPPASPSPSATSAPTSRPRASTSSSTPSAGCAGSPACGSGAARAARTPTPCAPSPLRCPPAPASASSGCREYRNQEIVRDVFDHVDAIVVPLDLGRELAARHP